MDISRIKLIDMDLDGTLTQHKSKLEEENREVLNALGCRYRLLMVGAGQCERIFRQMNDYTIDIVGNYGLQYSKYNPVSKKLDMIRNLTFTVERPSVEERILRLREKYGYTTYRGEGVEYHASGCVTFPLLGTEAHLADKLAFDPERTRRRAMYEEVVRMFPEYTVFVGGTSSFDMAPMPYNKYYALDIYCAEAGLSHEEVLFVGDDYGQGGNDESVYLSDIPFLKIDNYRDFPTLLAPFLK